MSKLVPPMSTVMAFGSPACAARATPPITPAAGPESTVRTGLLAAVSAPVMPPFDCMMWTSVWTPAPATRGLQRPEVAGRSRRHVGVDRRRAHPVELLELRQDVRGEGDGHAGKLRGQHLADRPLVRRVGVGVEQADGDGVDVRPPHPLDHVPGRPGLQRRQHLAGVEHALLHFEAEPPGYQRLGPPHPPVVQHRPVLPSDQQHVAEAGGGYQGGARPLPLQQGIDGDGGAVDEEADAGGVEAVAVDEQADALRDGERLVRRGRRRLGELDPVPLHVVQGRGR